MNGIRLVVRDDLVARNLIGHGSAAHLLLTVGANVERLHSETSFVALCGVSPVPASFGKTMRHRLNRGDDRAANSVLHVIAIGRLRTDTWTPGLRCKMNFAAAVESPLRLGYALPTRRLKRSTLRHQPAENPFNEAKRCSDKAGHLSRPVEKLEQL